MIILRSSPVLHASHSPHSTVLLATLLFFSSSGIGASTPARQHKKTKWTFASQRNRMDHDPRTARAKSFEEMRGCSQNLYFVFSVFESQATRISIRPSSTGTDASFRPFTSQPQSPSNTKGPCLRPVVDHCAMRQETQIHCSNRRTSIELRAAFLRRHSRVLPLPGSTPPSLKFH
jgi:hypothetical protein